MTGVAIEEEWGLRRGIVRDVSGSLGARVRGEIERGPELGLVCARLCSCDTGFGWDMERGPGSKLLRGSLGFQGAVFRGKR